MRRTFRASSYYNAKAASRIDQKNCQSKERKQLSDSKTWQWRDIYAIKVGHEKLLKIILHYALNFVPIPRS